MKILHIIPYFQPEYGYEEYFSAVAQQRLGHDVFVATSKFYNPILKNRKRVKINADSLKISIKDKIKIIRLPSLELPKSCQNFLFGLNRLIKKINPDLLYVHGPENTVSFQVLLAQITLSCKYVVDVHNDGTNLTDLNNQSLINRFKTGYKYLIVNIQMKKADKVIFFSEDHKNIFIKKYPLGINKTICVPIGVSTERFIFNEADRIKIRKDFNIGRDEFVAIISGRIVAEKDYDKLIRSIGLINKSIRLIVAGGITADYKYNLQNIASKNGLTKESIIFVGDVYNRDLSKFYCAADVGFWVSNYSVGILEAYACGLPVILGKKATMYYPAISDSLLVENGYFDEAMKIADILRQDKELLLKLRKESREIAENRSYTKMVDRIFRSIF